jgi:hypothetical protein
MQFVIWFIQYITTCYKQGHNRIIVDLSSNAHITTNNGNNIFNIALHVRKCDFRVTVQDVLDYIETSNYVTLHKHTVEDNGFAVFTLDGMYQGKPTTYYIWLHAQGKKTYNAIATYPAHDMLVVQ